MNKAEEKHKASVNVTEESQISPVTGLKRYLLVLLYEGQNGDFIIKLMNERLKTLLPDYIKTDVAFQDKQFKFLS